MTSIVSSCLWLCCTIRALVAYIIGFWGLEASFSSFSSTASRSLNMPDRPSRMCDVLKRLMTDKPAVSSLQEYWLRVLLKDPSQAARKRIRDWHPDDNLSLIIDTLCLIQRILEIFKTLRFVLKKKFDYGSFGGTSREVVQQQAYGKDWHVTGLDTICL